MKNELKEKENAIIKNVENQMTILNNENQKLNEDLNINYKLYINSYTKNKFNELQNEVTRKKKKLCYGKKISSLKLKLLKSSSDDTISNNNKAKIDDLNITIEKLQKIKENSQFKAAITELKVDIPKLSKELEKIKEAKEKISKPNSVNEKQKNILLVYLSYHNKLKK